MTWMSGKRNVKIQGTVREKISFKLKGLNYYKNH